MSSKTAYADMQQLLAEIEQAKVALGTAYSDHAGGGMGVIMRTSISQ